MIEDSLNEVYLHKIDDDLERLMEVDSSVKAQVEKEQKQKKCKFCLLFFVLLCLTVFIYLEITNKTKVSQKVMTSLEVEKKRAPQDGKVIPLRSANGSPLLVYEPVINTELIKNPIPANYDLTSEDQNELQK